MNRNGACLSADEAGGWRRIPGQDNTPQQKSCGNETGMPKDLTLTIQIDDQGKSGGQMGGSR